MDNIQCFLSIRFAEWIIIPKLDLMENWNLLEREENFECLILKLTTREGWLVVGSNEDSKGLSEINSTII